MQVEHERPLARDGAGAIAIAVALAVAIVPISIVSVAVVQRAFARLLPPRTLAKLDFSRGIPADARTLVVIPTLLGRMQDVDDMIRQVELHYLANPDPALGFALLGPLVVHLEAGVEHGRRRRPVRRVDGHLEMDPVVRVVDDPELAVDGEDAPRELGLQTVGR